MTDQVNDQQFQADAAVVHPEALGQCLRAAREAKGMTQQDISNSLRYSVRQIDALENHRFDELPDAMMTRGFIRSYAKLLDHDAEPLLAIYRKAVGADEDKLISINSSMPPVPLSRQGLPWLKYILASIVVLLLLMAWLFYVEYMPEKSANSVGASADPSASETVIPLTPQPAETMPEAALPAAERSAETEVSVLNGEASQTLTQQTIQQPDIAKLDTKAGASKAMSPDQSIAAGQVPAVQAKTLKVELTFTGDSWVGIKDKDGKVLYEEVSHAGDTDVLEFSSPVNVVIGKADATKLMLNGKLVDTTSSANNNVARITLE